MKSKRSRPPSVSGHHGFTLMEVLLSIFLFSLIIMIVLTAFSRTMGNVEAVQRTVTAYETAKCAMDRIILDLESLRITMPPAYKQPQGPDDVDPLRIVCEEETVGAESMPVLRFVSQAHVDLAGDGRTGLAEITYYAAPDKLGGLALHRRDILDWELVDEPGDWGGDPILCDHLANVEFSFFDEEGDTAASWNSDSEDVKFTTPRAVGVLLEIESYSGEESTPFRFETTVSLPLVREK